MRDQGAEVVYLEDLMAETLRSVPGLKGRFIRDFIQAGGGTARLYSDELTELLSAQPDELSLVTKTMTGVTVQELPAGAGKSPLARLSGSQRYVLDPLPNLYFTRDPFSVIGEGVSIHSMFSTTRRREAIYGDYIMTYHPDYAGQVRRYFERSCPFSLEGGDIFNLSRETVAVGISQRTSPEAIEVLSQNLFADETSPVRHVLALEIPALRAFMHLDTVFTQVDRDKFTVHPAILSDLRIFHITPGAKDALRVEEMTEGLEEVLCRLLGLDRAVMIRCGGRDVIASEREQWNDGSNTLCVAPGKIVVYDRNYVTNQHLRSFGLEVFEMPSSELSRGRGGPRCMSMPLYRAEIE